MSIVKRITGFFVFLLRLLRDSISEVIHDILQETGIKEKNLEAFLADKGLSELLKYKDYEETSDSECGIYHMSDLSKAFIMRIVPPNYVSSKTEGRISELLSSVDIDDEVVQFVTFASRNIEKHLKKFEEFHTGNAIKIDNPIVLENIIKKRIEELRRWTNESMASGIDFRIKDFHNLLVVIFPAETEDSVIYKKFDETKSMMGEFSPQNYNADSLISILSEIFYFNEDPSVWDAQYDSKMEMNHQLVSGGVKFTTKKDFNGFKANDKVLYRTLTTKSFPRDLSLFDYNNAFFDKMGTTSRIPVSTSFLMSLTIRFDNVKKRKEKVLSKLNHDIGELSKLRPLDLKKRPDLKERLRETEDNIHIIKEENETPVKAMWTLTIMDTDEKKLNEQVSAIKQKLSDLGWETIEESSNNIAFMTFLYSLPAMFSETVEETSKRFRILFKSNHASMAPMIGDSLGVGEYNLLTVGRTGQIQRFDPFAKGAAENPNIIKAGGSGSGKSFSESEFQASSVSAGYLVRVIDAGGSYETLCKSIGGQYIDFEEDSSLSLNFFTKARTRILDDGEMVLHEDEVTSITSIIGLMGAINLASEFKAGANVENITKIGVFTESIIKAVNTAFKRAKFAAKLEDVRDIIIEISEELKKNDRLVSQDLENFASSIYRFADERGPYSKYFNPPNNVDFKKDYVVVETQSLLNSGNDLFVVVVAMLTNQIKNEFFDKKLISKKKILTIDEAKPILDNKISLELLVQIYRKIRKYNGLANTITQSINDFFSNDDVKVLYEIAGWRWFLKQNDGVIAESYESGRLSVSRFEKQLLESIKNNPPSYGEYYLSSENVALLSRLKVDALTYWTYSTDGTDKQRVNDIMKEYSINEGTARTAMSMISEGRSKEDAINSAKSNSLFQLDASKVVSLVEKHMKRVINNKSLIKITSLDVKSKQDNCIVFSELFAEISNDDGITNRHIYPNRDKISNIEEYDVIVIERLLEFASGRKNSYSINVSIKSLQNNNVLIAMRKYAMQKEGFAERIIFELPLANVDHEHSEELNYTIKELKQIGYKIANDNLKTGERLLNVLTYDVDYIKLTPMIYSDSEEALNSEIILTAMKTISKAKNIPIVATMIDSKIDYDALNNHSYIDLMQGFYVSEKKTEH